MIAEKQLSFPGPETITRRVLDNGIIVLARQNPASPSVVVRGLLHVGANDDPADKLGLANFTTEALDRGTTTRTFSQINEAVEAVGASFGIGSGRHTASFGTKSLVDDLDLVLDITADVLRNPTFPPAEVEKVRGQLITMLQERENNTRAVADDIFRELAYPTHPYGRPADGTLESVRSIVREDIETFYRQTFSPL
ncbi:MAG: insulinase family protein, partial [Chloroflexi bacterium]|nr:insulinase family protein [Chloroflexota bacterium]